MKKLLKKLFAFGKRFNDQWNPWMLHWRIRLLETGVFELGHKATEAYSDKKAAQYLAEQYRAQLCQLRAWQSDEHGRTGWMVSCFIPVESIKRLEALGEAAQNDFKRLVVDVLVTKAMEGVYHINKAGKLSALIFEPPNLDNDKARRICTPIFEVEKNSFAAIRDCKIPITEKDLAEQESRARYLFERLPEEIKKISDRPPTTYLYLPSVP